PPDLRALVGILDPPAEVARSDRLRRVLDPYEGSQAQADEPESEADYRGHDRERDEQLDEQQMVERRFDLVQRRSDDELRPVGEHLEVRAVVGRPSRPDCYVLFLVRPDGATLRETRLRQNLLASKWLRRPPDH